VRTCWPPLVQRQSAGWAGVPVVALASRVSPHDAALSSSWGIERL
jgi:hypothetical protein